jgi:hypothetical protein
LEGSNLCDKLAKEDFKLQMRYMDELFLIEQNFGEVQAVIGLQSELQKDYVDETEMEYEVFPEPEPVPVKLKNPDDEEEEEPVNEEEDEEEKKKPKFKVEDYKWTITDRKPKNLPQLFLQSKGIAARHYVKQADQFGQTG